MGIPERRALGSPSQHQLLGFWERLCYNGVSVILETGLKTIGLESECFQFLVLEEMFSIVDVPTKTHRPTNATRPKEALESAYLMFLWTFSFQGYS